MICNTLSQFHFRKCARPSWSFTQGTAL